ncbi:hypothetical protein LHFGNBLO_004361 [Mesorhizobium sp. AR10]|uniref:hypothetical protein n=1 Tax=Mesorhizobium sp. AR10 TaxID=2865839 RepID=UPI002160F2EA|nr:hypothetical protein [Mesorhizobium sp. AR10]UVK41768.1 hypothetical protein LHFGNBLO_004361 [Mesorhizobium sp. AR10]
MIWKSGIRFSERSCSIKAGRLELELRFAAIAAERTSVRAMLRSGEINDHTAQALFAQITLTEAL